MDYKELWFGLKRSAVDNNNALLKTMTLMEINQLRAERGTGLKIEVHEISISPRDPEIIKAFIKQLNEATKRFSF